MGTSTNQIATRANIQTGKRKMAYDPITAAHLQKCPTKGEINQIEFLDVKDSLATTYDNNYKLVKYEDIGIDSSRIFAVYYGIWNDKNSTARLDYARALINTTPDGTTSGWTQVGQVTLSDIAGNGTKTGTITCTLPADIDLGAQQYYLLIKVGDTLNNQDFYGGWGSTSGGTSYTYCRKAASGWTPSVPLTPTSLGGNSVLNYIDINNSGTTTVTNGIYKSNTEYKGWIKIQ